MAKEDTTSQIFVVSDATGETCAAAVRGALLQVQSPSRLRRMLRAGMKDKGVPMQTQSASRNRIIFTNPRRIDN